MRVSAILAAIAFAPAAFAQSSSAASGSASASASASASGAAGNSSATAGAAYLQQVLGALTAANLTGLVGVASAIANTSDGQALLAQLATGNRTVFAPNDDAFAAVNSSVSSNTTLLTQILSYHILNGSYTVNNTGTAPNHTIARSLLAGSYSLPGNLTAPLVLSKNSSNATFFNVVQATDNVTAQGPAQAANLLVYIIGEVLSLPQTVSQVATTLFPSLAGVIQQVGLLAPLEAAPAITVFAPSNDAISAIQSALGTLNSTQITTVLANHVINGTIVYSTGLATANYTSAAGQPFTFLTNSSGSYVTSANSTARIVQSDIILKNGVAHIIDSVLVNTAANSTAAGAAYSSNVAAQSTAAATSQASASASGSKAAAGHVAPFALTNSMVGGAVAVLGAMLGGGYILA